MSSNITVLALLLSTAAFAGEPQALQFDSNSTFALSGKEGGGGSDLGSRFAVEAQRVSERIKNIKQQVIDVEDLQAVLDSGVEIVPVPVLIHPVTKSPIVDQSLDAYSNQSYIQLLDWKWGKYLSDSERTKHDDLIAHELFRVAQILFPTKDYNDSGYRLSVGKLGLNQRASQSFEKKTNLQVMKTVFSQSHDQIDLADLPFWDKMRESSTPMRCFGAVAKTDSSRYALEETYEFVIGIVQKQEQPIGPLGGGNLVSRAMLAVPKDNTLSNQQILDHGQWQALSSADEALAKGYGLSAESCSSLLDSGVNDRELCAVFNFASGYNDKAYTAYRKFGAYITFRVTVEHRSTLSGLYDAYGYCYPTP